MRCIVCDTGPLLHLGEAGAIDLLALAGKIHVPRAVEREMGRLHPGWSAKRPAWISVVDLLDPQLNFSKDWLQSGLLNAGEAEAISLAQQLGADWLLTDDAAARVFAESWEIEVHGSLGIVIWAVARGHIDKSGAMSYLEGLESS